MRNSEVNPNPDRPEPEKNVSKHKRLVQQWRALRRFVHEELWDVDLAALPRLKTFGVSLIRIATIVGKKLSADKCALQSAALSYITLISLVPLLALTFAASRGLGAHEQIMTIVAEQLIALPQKTRTFVEHVLELVNRVNYGALGTLGLLIIFVAAVGMLAKIEKSFNTIWGVQKPRNTFRKFTDYISIIVIVPLLMLVATSVNTALSSGHFAVYLETNLGPVYWMYEGIIGLSGILILCLAFAFLYMFMPNTNVRLLPALLAGIVAGSLWFLAQRIYIQWQVGVTLNNAIYGTFAAIPFFLGWLYVSWLIVLFGAEVCFGIQNLRSFVMERESTFSSPSTRELIGLTATFQVCLAFTKGDPPWSADEFARQNDIPHRLITDVMNTLVRQRLLLNIDNDRENLYVPAQDPARITLRSVFDAFRGLPDGPAQRVARRKAETAYQYFDPELTSLRENLDKTNFRVLTQKSSACNDDSA